MKVRQLPKTLVDEIKVAKLEVKMVTMSTTMGVSGASFKEIKKVALSFCAVEYNYML